MSDNQWSNAFTVARERYAAAFAAVQDVLAARVADAVAAGEVSPAPAHVFAIAHMDLAALAALSPPLAEAEAERRARRAALHAIAELIAHGDAAAPGAPDGSPAVVAAHAGDARDMRRLDAFITVVNTAQEAGCIYINGTFEPMRRAGAVADS